MQGMQGTCPLYFPSLFRPPHTASSSFYPPSMPQLTPIKTPAAMRAPEVNKAGARICIKWLLVLRALVMETEALRVMIELRVLLV
jgi:hypothetical protein